MPTFNYLIRGFMTTPQAWLALAIVSQLRQLKAEGVDEPVSIDRLLAVWQVIAENLTRRTLQAPVTEAALPLPFGFDDSMQGPGIPHEA